MDLIEFIGFTAGLLVALSSLPQLIKSWKTKQTKDIAIMWLLINIAGQVLWMAYGYFKDSLSLIVMSAITLLMVSSVLILKMRYDRK
ncbi:MAG: SemiSWEET family transporter [Nanoarchaeota archaeon]